ncbi:hypothetical protein P170DRAFT_450379 [Aspergillus steynii IBT 23096]|uniref:Rhodopsin domain-containing protein n=1 Tax=Aspergillus steynii IBT 23096 TaxID=1392250 RepID=A0A2I2FUB2_9EURO|nr:uncharacterized protein P170DRAFT_450379 [Aspergillus steynii IBT 23096]PLB44204.1 hypothetical protein P170DRAFT_450379 [Aspergillus steynii IBT 23096]
MDSHALYARGIDSGSRQATVFGVGIGFMAFITVVIALRVYARAVILRAMGADDVFMVIGTILTFGLSISSIIAAYYGVGRHIDDISESDFTPMLKAVWATRIVYIAGLLFVRLSLLWFYLRLDQRPLMRWSVYTLIFINVGLSVSSIIVVIVSCVPVSKFWDLEGTAPGKCMNPDAQQIFYEANGILNIILDIFIYIVPMPTLWSVKISNVHPAGCVRYDFVKKLAHNKDQYYYLADSLNWCSIECYVAIFCGSAPALQVIIKTYAPRVLGTSNAQKYDSQKHTPGQGYSNRMSTMYRMSRHRRLETDRGGSQDAIVPGSAPENGIVMKTDIRMEVTDRDSEEGKRMDTGFHVDFGH